MTSGSFAPPSKPTTSLLADVTVLDLSSAGPALLGAYLADFGADVVKVEQPVRGDVIHAVRSGLEGGENLQSTWNRGKRSVALELGTDAGAAVFLDLVRHADVVIEAMRPGMLERRGLSIETLLEANPALVFVSLSGFGRSGPLAELPAHGMAFDAWAGLTPPAEDENGRVHMPRALPFLGVESGPLFAAIGTLAAVIHARATGKGCTVEVAEADCAAYLNRQDIENIANGVPEGRDDRFFTDSVRYQYYRCSDGRPFLFMCLMRKYWERFCAAISRTDLLERYPNPELTDARGDDALRAELTDIFAERIRDQWALLFRENHLPGLGVNANRDVLDDDHFRERGRWLDPEVHGARLLANPVHIHSADGPQADPDAAPEVGAHTVDVLVGLLGYDADRIEELRASGALGRRSEPPGATS